MRRILPLTTLAVAVLAATQATAQPKLDNNTQAAPQAAARDQVIEIGDASKGKEEPQRQLKKFDADSYPSLLFTYWEQVAIEDARRSTDGLQSTPTDADINQSLDSEFEDIPMPPPEERYITLSGIAFKAKENWTIWLNGQRVTPDAIPPEATDLKVFDEYIEIKWFDEYTNRIIPIRLRPHQRFNIDTRIFLPG